MKPSTNNTPPQGYKMTELGALPEEWEVVPLDNKYIEFQNGLWKGKKEPYIKVRVLRNTNFNNDGTIDFEDVAELDVEQRNFKNREIIKDDIILERSGGGPTQPVGRVVFFEREDQFMYSFSNFTSRIRISDKLIIFPKFLFYFLLDFYNQGKTNDIQNRTTGIRNLDFSRYKQIPIPLPPLPEQQKIAAVLSAVQEAKEKTEAVIKATKALKKSMMKHLFTYGPVSPEEVENIQLKETEIGPVPEDWEVVKLGEVAESFIGGGTPPTDIKEYWNGTVHWTTSKKINDLYLLNGEKKITEKGLKESSTHLIPKDNLIIGTRVGVGKVAINKIDIAISQDLTGVFIDKKKYSLEYLAYQISTDQIQKYFKDCTRGTTIKGIPRDDLKRLPLQIPPLPIQQKIASILSAIDAKIEAEENKKKALEELFKSLLHNLMTAKIRVNNLKLNEKDI